MENIKQVGIVGYKESIEIFYEYAKNLMKPSEWEKTKVIFDNFFTEEYSLFYNKVKELQDEGNFNKILPFLILQNRNPAYKTFNYGYDFSYYQKETQEETAAKIIFNLFSYRNDYLFNEGKNIKIPSTIGKTYLTDLKELDATFHFSRISQKNHDIIQISNKDLPRNAIVIRNGKIYKIEILNEKQEVATFESIVNVISEIIKKQDVTQDEFGINLITGMERDKYSEVNEHVKNLSLKNKEYLEIIAKSPVIVLDHKDNYNITQLERGINLLCNYNFWFDKTNYLIHKIGGRIGCYVEESIQFAYVFQKFTNYLLDNCETTIKNIAPKLHSQPLNFDVDSKIENSINSIKENIILYRKTFQLETINFPFGRKKFKSYGLNLYFVLNHAIQFAYYMVYEKMAFIDNSLSHLHLKNGHITTYSPVYNKMLEFCKVWTSHAKKLKVVSQEDLYYSFEKSYKKFYKDFIFYKQNIGIAEICLFMNLAKNFCPELVQKTKHFTKFINSIFFDIINNDEVSISVLENANNLGIYHVENQEKFLPLGILPCIENEKMVVNLLARPKEMETLKNIKNYIMHFINQIEDMLKEKTMINGKL